MLIRQVDPKVYNEEYFEADCGGHEEWEKYKGEGLPARLETAYELGNVSKGMKVLDWGCGRGEITLQSAKAGAEATGMDYSETAIKLCQRLKKPRYGKMKFIHNTDLLIPFKDGTFDRIFFIDVIEHLYPEQVNEIMKEFARVLKPKGKLILHTAPNREYYDKGYKYWTRHAHKLANPVWQLVFRENLRSDNSPRFGYDKDVHINECSLSDVVGYITSSGMKPEVWYDSSFRSIRLRDKIRYSVFQPQVSMLKKWFSEDIWAIATK